MPPQQSNADGGGYFLYHSIGMYPGKAEAIGGALSEFAGSWGECDDGQWMRALTVRQAFIDRWREIIGAPEGTLTTAENVTTALYSLVGALPERHLKDRRVLVAGDCFPSLHFLLSGLAGRLGFTLETVPLRPGESWVRSEDMVAAWSADVGLALLTFVTSMASHRCDLETLAAHGRRMGSLVGVDITQGVGILPYRVDAPQVDFTLSTTLKWLCGTPGAGILHVAEPLLRECRPELRGWFSQENIFSWALDAFAYAPDARRFDHGTPSVLACAGSLGLKLMSPADESRRGGSVMLRLPADTAPARIVDGLRGRGIFVDCRGSTLRVSPGCVTTAQGVERLIAGLGDLLG